MTITLTPKDVEGLAADEAAALLYDWDEWARPSQQEPPGDWTYWVLMAGRGFGKTRVGAEATRRWAMSGDFEYVNIIGATADDARDIMIEGESGIEAVCPSWERPEYFPSKRRLDWPNGCRTLIFTADEPERLRGKQHSRIWADELSAWRYVESWDQAMFGLRLPPDPRAVITMTPKPLKMVRDLIKNPKAIVVGGSTYDNRENLAEAFFSEIIRQYEGTRLGRQELLAELLDDVEGALWTRKRIEEDRVAKAPELVRVVVGVDPSASDEEASNEAGIVVAGMGAADRKGYVLADRTVRGSPEAWAMAAVDAYHEFEADTIIAERNQGGDMVKSVIKNADPTVGVRTVWASRGKRTRAEPVAQLYEQHRVHHVGAEFENLEDQMCMWTPKPTAESPDRMDALVWALTDLMLDRSGRSVGRETRRYTEPVRQAGDITLVGEQYVDKE